MLQFGHECLRTKNWEGRLPLLMSHAHHAIAEYMGEQEKAAYYRQPQAWKAEQGIMNSQRSRQPPSQAAHAVQPRHLKLRFNLDPCSPLLLAR
jgi:hypothetical protein